MGQRNIFYSGTIMKKILGYALSHDAQYHDHSMSTPLLILFLSLFQRYLVWLTMRHRFVVYVKVETTFMLYNVYL